MKNKVLYAAAALGLLISAGIFSCLEQDTEIQRYHQHREQPGEAALGVCETCGSASSLCTHLPVIRIETGGQKIPGAAILDEETFLTVGYETGTNGEEEIQAVVSTVEQEGQWHHAEDEATQSSYAMIRYRGDTSRAFSKHNYLIKLVEKDQPEQNRNLPLLGMDADNEWALHGPFLDKTLLRNYMWMNLSAEVMGQAPDVRFCELIVDGAYQGLYVLMETNTQGDGRVDLTEYRTGDPVCSYIVRIGTETNPLKTIENFTFYTQRMEKESEFEVLYPTRPYQTETVKDYICTDLSGIEKLLYSFRMQEDPGAWRDVLDADSFVDYYVLQEFLGVSDMFSKSTYFYRDIRGKLCIGPVWDYNNVLDNFFRPVPADEFILSQRGWYGALMTDERFVEQVIHRYQELRQSLLSDESLNAYIDETLAWLGDAVDRNYEVWGYSFDVTQLTAAEYRQPPLDKVYAIIAESGGDLVLEDERMMQEVLKYNPANFEEAVDWMRSYMVERGAWLDTHIESLRQYCADSKNATRFLN